MTPDKKAVLLYASTNYKGEPWRGMIATAWFASHMGRSGATTRQAYRLLRRMAADGLMEGVSAYGSNRVRWWRVTDAGVAALAETK